MDQLMEYFENEKKIKIKRYHILNQYAKLGQILFTGSSLMEQFPIYEFVQDYNMRETIYNRGIGGYTTEEMLQSLDVMVFELAPSKIFINIGTNDLNAVDFVTEKLIKSYENILNQITIRLPDTKIYVMAYYPVNGEADFGNVSMEQLLKVRTNERIQETNIELEKMAQRLNVNFININQNLFDECGNLKYEYSVEGMHMYANGYLAIFEELVNYIRE